MNSETVNDIAKLIMHRIVWRHRQNDEGLLVRSLERIEAFEREHGKTDYSRQWRTAVTEGGASLRKIMWSKDDHSRWLRLSSPVLVASSLDLANLDTRRRIWRAAKRIAAQATGKNRLELGNEPNGQNDIRFG